MELKQAVTIVKNALGSKAHDKRTTLYKALKEFDNLVQLEELDQIIEDHIREHEHDG